MTIGIYVIRHVVDGKRYVGKSSSIESRFANHRWNLSQPTCAKSCNRHLYNAVQRDGIAAFVFEVIEVFASLCETTIAERELHWMDFFDSCSREHGYNLRRDSSSRMIVHEETRALKSLSIRGESNPNFGNAWSSAARERMSMDAKRRHAEGCYGDEWLAKKRCASKRQWGDPSYAEKVASGVSRAKRKYNYFQYSRDGKFIDCFDSIERIVGRFPDAKWQNIYSACSGHKPTYMGYRWVKKLKSEGDDL